MAYTQNLYVNNVSIAARNSTTVDLLLAPKAGFWIRALAFTLDKILTAMIAAILFLSCMLLLDYLGILEIKNSLFDSILAGNLLYSMLISYTRLMVEGIYFTFFHGYNGQTLGKMAVNIRVVNIKGEKLTYRQSFKRWVGYFLSGLILGIGYLMVAFTKDNQGLHDKMAETYVVKL